MQFKTIALLPFAVATMLACIQSSNAKLVKKMVTPGSTTASQDSCPSDQEFKDGLVALCNRTTNCTGYDHFKLFCKEGQLASELEGDGMRMSGAMV